MVPSRSKCSRKRLPVRSLALAQQSGTTTADRFPAKRRCWHTQNRLSRCQRATRTGRTSEWMRALVVFASSARIRNRQHPSIAESIPARMSVRPGLWIVGHGRKNPTTMGRGQEFFAHP
jgi:hypothetical protein